MSTPREPLSPEERVLAERLGRAPGPREPGPALDARILAAARAAVDDAPDSSQAATGAPRSPAVPATRRPNRRRWTLGFGVAASLLLAVTVAWQLRPQRGTQIVYETADAPAVPQPVAELPTRSPTADSDAAGSTASAPDPVILDPPMALARSAPPSPKPVPVPFDLPPPRAPAMMAPAPPEAPRDERRKNAADQDAAAAPARKAQVPRRADAYTPPAPPAPPAPTPSLQGYAAPPPPAPMPDVGASMDAPTARQATADRAAPLAAQARFAADLSAPGVQDAVAEDSRLPADAWLQRVRRHRFDGNSALARASLQAFRQAHPDQAIPEDLRPLLP